MKPNASLRLIVASIVTLLGVLLIESGRNGLIRGNGKGVNKGNTNPHTTTVSSTEYIFFEALSNPLFFSR